MGGGGTKKTTDRLLKLDGASSIVGVGKSFYLIIYDTYIRATTMGYGSSM